MNKVFICCFFMFLLIACDQENQPGDSPVESVTMNISTKSLDQTVQARIIVADAQNGEIIFNKYPLNLSSSYDMELPTKTLIFYVLANEPDELTPKLSAISGMDKLSPLTINFADLPIAENPENSNTNTNLPAIGSVTAQIRYKTGSNSLGEASTDNGTTWSTTLNVTLGRLAAKINLQLRKQTTPASDVVKIKKVEVVNIPEYYNLISTAYTGSGFTTHTYTPASTVEFNTNTTGYTSIFSNLIVPEYILTDPSASDKALTLLIYAEYNTKTVLYKVPVRYSLSAENYNLERNKEYTILASITSMGEIIYQPQVNYIVADWDDANQGVDIDKESTITFDASWAAGTNINGRDVWVANHDYLEFSFTLSHPEGATWAATLTNSVDFMFDNTDGAVSYGVTRVGEAYTIRIRPRRETSLNDVRTEFYITVNNHVENIELNLPNLVAGTGNRYTITQIPN